MERIVDVVYESYFEKDISRYLADAIVYFMLYDEDFLKQFSEYVVPRVFAFPYRPIMECIAYFWTKHKKVLGDSIFHEIKRFAPQGQASLVEEFLKRIKGNRYDKEYVLKETGNFVKKLVLLEGIGRAQEAIKRGEFNYAEGIVRGVFKDVSRFGSDAIVDVIDASLQGNGFMDFCNSLGALNMRTGMSCYDNRYGGLWTKEFLLIMGDTNVGKTFCVVYLGKLALLQGKKVLHVTLETSKELVQERYFMSLSAKVSRRFYEVVSREGDFFNVADDGFESKDSDIKEKLEVQVGNNTIEVEVMREEHIMRKLEFLKRRGARLWLYQGVGFSVRDLVELLEKIEIEYGEKVDIVLLDSPDQMISGSKVSDEVRLRERDIYRRLLDLTKERNITTVVTTQARRGSRNKFLLTSEDVAEAYDKVRIADTVWVINQTKKEAEANIVRIYVDKCRHAKPGLLIEADQCLPIGQFILNPRELNLAEYLTQVGLIKK